MRDPFTHGYRVTVAVNSASLLMPNVATEKVRANILASFSFPKRVSSVDQTLPGDSAHDPERFNSLAEQHRIYRR